MRAKDLTPGQTVAATSDRDLRYARLNRCVVLSTEPFIRPRSASRWGRDESKPVERPEGILDHDGLPQWTDAMPVRATGWKQSEGYDFSKRAAGVLVLRQSAYSDAQEVAVVPLAQIRGDWETVSAEKAALQDAERVAKQREKEYRQDRDERFEAARARINPLLDTDKVVRESHGPAYNTSGTVRLTVAQFEALVALATRLPQP